ncbi:DUF397 domain-containing protein [Actinomadura sp. LD22]|uniref:DUF397 domain-containing protein n=1 Tax=Actinomadura physcomitrii TaxID=2650748 RepID=A0A6I4M5Z5_9ACTN|nr:DUF397 domain-containing protein [Actinomadura physcomitrii]MVZ99566.1 DUF397 domain-containing protein [Actinomadura physcomitrii]
MPGRADDDATGSAFDARANAWRKSGRCQETCCVEVARHPDGIAVRDSKQGNASPVLVISRAAFRALRRLPDQTDPRR